ncbi:GNAT family N-acetyltransferase [Alkalimonas sp.]|uniref:GNAT family N-acetyltransferase n=1 Tax=Alkalimonas sp. TaxID=1872453 RepID=UPI00263B94B3|nr:GNAT family N-acetyltransferase [Alkalimonas sp.]MCC5825869.1 GNAT family N-acetyltransferase [Alkalimonas sp.]
MALVCTVISGQALRTSWQPLQDLAEIATDWQQLEADADGSFFVSWLWVRVWLQSYQPDLMVMRVYAANELVGLALFSCSFERRHRLIGSRVLRLHQTGVASQDQIWIEYNTVLARRGMTRQVDQAVLNGLLQWQQWDELVLAGVDAHQAKQWQQAPLHRQIDWQQPCFGVDLQAIRDSGQSYLASLSANCRYQINRSKRRYQQVGELRLEQAQNVQQALQWFDAISPWHQQRWGSEAGQSGFANPEFLAFHRALIKAAWAEQSSEPAQAQPAKGAELLTLMAGQQHLATFYQLRYRNRIYFYLAGFRPELDKQLKPGLVGHSLCIEHYCRQGLAFYDFMAGDERYKRQLGQPHAVLCQLRLQHARARFRLESFARQSKHKLRTLFGATSQQ